MGRIKTKSKKRSIGGRIAETAVNAVLGRGGSGGGRRRRSKGPTYWANKVLVEKLKKRYMRLKYGGAR